MTSRVDESLNNTAGFVLKSASVKMSLRRACDVLMMCSATTVADFMQTGTADCCSEKFKVIVYLYLPPLTSLVRL